MGSGAGPSTNTRPTITREERIRNLRDRYRLQTDIMGSYGAPIPREERHPRYHGSSETSETSSRGSMTPDGYNELVERYLMESEDRRSRR